MLRTPAGPSGKATRAVARAIVAVLGLFTATAAQAGPEDDKAALASPLTPPKVPVPYKLLSAQQSGDAAQAPAPATPAKSEPAKAETAKAESAKSDTFRPAVRLKADDKAPKPPVVQQTAAPTPAPAAPAATVTIAATPATPVAPAAPAAATENAKPVAPAKPQITLAIDIDLTRQRMTLTEHGKVVGQWAISSGREGYRSPTGTFRPLWSARMWYSKKYDNAPMPHAVFFSGGVAMHATYATGMLGQPASHGCIRQSPANAATTYKLVQKHGNAGTRIVVHGQPRFGEERIARRDRKRGGNEGYAQVASRPSRGADRAEVGMRKVIIVDSWGNRRMGLIRADDPRLAGYAPRRAAQRTGSNYASASGKSGFDW